MSHLEIHDLTGSLHTLELSKKQPVSIGRSATNDITVNDDADVESMHCRISWNKNSFVVTSATDTGVDLNGVYVKQSRLYSDDVLRIGNLDIILKSEESRRPININSNENDLLNVELAPITDDSFKIPIQDKASIRKLQENERQSQMKNKKSSAQSRSQSNQSREPAEETLLPDDFFDDDDILGPADDDIAEAQLVDDDEDDEEGGAYSLAGGASTNDASENEEDAELAGKPVLKRMTSEEAAAAVADEEDVARPQESLLEKLKPRQVRPGEQDIIRSPFVLSLTSGSLILLLLAAIFWLIIGRETSSKQFDNAMAAYNAGQYNQAINQLQTFLQEYPQHRFTVQARFALGHANILKEISGSTPNWETGLKALDHFNREYRDLPDFPQERVKLLKYAQKIALGAAKSAAVAIDAEYLKISSDAVSMMDRLSPGDPALDEIHQQVQEAHRFAKAEIRKDGVYQSYLQEMNQLLTDHMPVQALIKREGLLTEYPEFDSDTTVRNLFNKALELEKELVTREETARDAFTDSDSPANRHFLALTRNTRARSDEVSQNRIIAAVAKDCCYGIDTITGETKWRQIIGLDSPFFPISVVTSSEGLLVFNTNQQELMLINRQDGKINWRQPIEGLLTGPPLIHESQIYLPTLNQRMYKLNLEAGRITAILNFTQNVLAPPVLTHDGNHMIVAGETGVLYTLSLRPLACQAVTYLGHATGTIQSPLMPLGAHLMVIQNDQLNSAKVQILDMRQATGQLTVVDETRLEGQIRDQAILRGKELFIPTRREQVYSFTVSDTTGQPSLSDQEQFQFQNPQPGPIFLSAGPDSQVWMASSALRKLELKSNAFKLVPGEIAQGQSVQPLQNIGNHLYVGRRSSFSSAIYFSRANRDTMTSQWRTVLGASVLEVLGTNGASTLFITETGDVNRLTQKDLAEGGFVFNTSYSPVIPNSVSDPVLISRYDDKTIAIGIGGEDPELILVNQAGQLSRRFQLEEPLVANPVDLKAGIVVPHRNRLKLMNRSGFAIKVQDLLADAGDQQSEWRQLTSLDDQQFLILNNRSKLARVQYRTDPAAHLSKVIERKFESAVDFNFVLNGQKLYLADSAGNVHELDASNLDTLQTVSLSAPATNQIWLQNKLLFVETGNKTLNCLSLAPKLKKLWSVELEHLAGSPLFDNQQLHVALQSGAYVILDAATGTVQKQADLGQTMNIGPQQLGSKIVLIAIDGTIYPAEDLVATKPQSKTVSLKLHSE